MAPVSPSTGVRRRHALALARLVRAVTRSPPSLSPRADRGIADGEQATSRPRRADRRLHLDATTEWQEKRAVRKAPAARSRPDRVHRRGGGDASIPTAPTDATERLERDVAVDFVEPNFVARAPTACPNDRSFGDQWGLRNLGHFDGKVGADIAATAAWDVTTGGNVTVAVVDTGVSYKHPDLGGQRLDEPGRPAQRGRRRRRRVRGRRVRSRLLHGRRRPRRRRRPRHPRRRHHRRRRATTRSASRASTGTRNVMALKFLDENGGGQHGRRRQRDRLRRGTTAPAS